MKKLQISVSSGLESFFERNAIWLVRQLASSKILHTLPPFVHAWKSEKLQSETQGNVLNGGRKPRKPHILLAH